VLQRACCAPVKSKFRLACIAHDGILGLKFCETFPNLASLDLFAVFFFYRKSICKGLHYTLTQLKISSCQNSASSRKRSHSGAQGVGAMQWTKTCSLCLDVGPLGG